MAVKPIPDGYNQAIPYLACRNAAAGARLLRQGLRRARADAQWRDSTGKIGHAEIEIGDCRRSCSPTSIPR